MTSGSGPWVPLASCLQSSPPTAAAQGWIPDPRHCPVLLSGCHLHPTDKPRGCTWLRAESFPAPAPFVRHLPSLPSSPPRLENPLGPACCLALCLSALHPGVLCGTLFCRWWPSCQSTLLLHTWPCLVFLPGPSSLLFHPIIWTSLSALSLPRPLLLQEALESLVGFEYQPWYLSANRPHQAPRMLAGAEMATGGHHPPPTSIKTGHPHTSPENQEGAIPCPWGVSRTETLDPKRCGPEQIR